MMKLANLPASALALACLLQSVTAAEVRRISVDEYVSRMKAGWIGQMAGVGWAAPTEFKFCGRIIPEDKMPVWRPETINQFNQDDIYVEMTFLRSLEVHGLDLDIRQAGIDFANSGYRLWHANLAGRDNLRNGIAPPDSSHPQFNKHADDIDYQIEADYSGLISPGLPKRVIKLGELFGRLMNYGDGVYGGQLVAAMYAEAFFESDMEKLVEAGLAAIPAQSQYHECVSDVLRWFREDPGDWEKTWRKVEDKYRKPEYSRFLCSPKSHIDAKLNGAYIVMGILFGKGDPDRTITISTRCGRDSDCNPSNAAGVLFTTMHFEDLPERFTAALDRERKFSHTPYGFDSLVSVCEMLARKIVVAEGGRIEKDGEGREVFVIPVQKPMPSAAVRSWEPGPIAGSRFTDAEMQQIEVSAGVDLSAAVKEFAPGWVVSNCGADMQPGLKANWGGRKKVLLTHPLDRKTACVFARSVAVPKGRKTILTLDVGHHPQGDWTLVVQADGREIARHRVGPDACVGGWKTIDIDLSRFAGKSPRIKLENRADGWRYEGGYWSRIEIVSK